MTKQLRKVALVSHILAHYREPIFHLLCREHDGIEYTFFADRVNTFSTVKTIDPAKAAIPVEQGGIRWHFVKNRFFGNWCWQSGVIRLSLSKHFDTIIYEGSVYYLSTWVAAALARLTNKKVLMWSHGFLRDERGLKGLLRKVFYRLAHGMLLYHQRSKDILVSRGFDANDLYVVCNSLDYDKQVEIRSALTEESKAACRAKLFRKPELPVLLFIGRLTPGKKLEMLIEAARLLADRSIECNILLVGDGPAGAGVQQKALELGISSNLCLYGACYQESELALLISSSDICVAPGEVGLTCMHSLVYGTPVITHDDPDYQMPEYEAITAGYNGMFFKRDSILEMATAIQKWLTGNTDRMAVAKRCHEIIDQRYNPHYQISVINAAIMNIGS